jgi:hypothetical protein
MLRFKNMEEANSNGYTRASLRGKTLHSHRNASGHFKIIVGDTSGLPNFGYSYAAILFRLVDNGYYEEKIELDRVESHDVFFSEEKNKIGDMGAYSSLFKIGEIDALENKMRAL